MEPAPRARFEIWFNGGTVLNLSVPSQAANAMVEELSKDEPGYSAVVDGSEVLNNVYINRSMIAYFRVFRV